MDSQVEADVEVAGGAAPKAALRVYFAPFSSRSFADAIDRAVGDRVSVISIGWGQPESAWTQTDVAVVNAALQRAALRGVTVVVASGDGGVTDGVKDGKRHVDFPASSPWVLAVGGTSFDRHSGAGEGEHAWSGSGGGESAIFPRPTWQSALTFRAPGSRVIGRALPDLASSADPAAGYPLMVDGSFVQMGGTTIAAPEVAALIACINQGLGRNVGWITPALYQGMGATALYDITVGDNTADGVTGFKAGPGWDAVTGWGSLDAARALAWLRSHGKSP